jgi:transcriptional regulator with XRE-family HTH domain
MNRSKTSQSLGDMLRNMRKKQTLPLRVVAAAANMDSTLLSKIELGQRLPTEIQTKAFAKFFKVPFEDLEAKRLAERFWMEHGDSTAAVKAALLIKESAADYHIASLAKKS